MPRAPTPRGSAAGTPRGSAAAHQLALPGQEAQAGHGALRARRRCIRLRSGAPRTATASARATASHAARLNALSCRVRAAMQDATADLDGANEAGPSQATMAEARPQRPTRLQTTAPTRASTRPAMATAQTASRGTNTPPAATWPRSRRRRGGRGRGGTAGDASGCVGAGLARRRRRLCCGSGSDVAGSGAGANSSTTASTAACFHWARSSLAMARRASAEGR